MINLSAPRFPESFGRLCIRVYYLAPFGTSNHISPFLLELQDSALGHWQCSISLGTGSVLGLWASTTFLGWCTGFGAGERTHCVVLHMGVCVGVNARHALHPSRSHCHISYSNSISISPLPSISSEMAILSTSPVKDTLVFRLSIPDVPSNTWTTARLPNTSRIFRFARPRQDKTRQKKRKEKKEKKRKGTKRRRHTIRPTRHGHRKAKGETTRFRGVPQNLLLRTALLQTQTSVQAHLYAPQF